VVLIRRVDLPEGGFTLRSEALALTSWEMNWVLECLQGIEYSRSGLVERDGVAEGPVSPPSN
jgi:hypothetical protein